MELEGDAEWTGNETKKCEFDLSNEKDLTGVNRTGDFFNWSLGHEDIVIRQRVSGDWL